jgi:COP9 signalosome complex subunit 6
MLKSRLVTLVDILKTQPEQIRNNPRLLREIQGMCNRIPVASSRIFTNEFFNEYSEALLVSYMSTMTKGTNIASELVEKLDQAGSTRNYF